MVSSPNPSQQDTVISAQKAISLRTRIANLEREHMKEFLKKQNLDYKPKPYELSTADIPTGNFSSDYINSLSAMWLAITVSYKTWRGWINIHVYSKWVTVEPPENISPRKSEVKVNRSIAAERRKLAKLRQAHRKAVLNSETNYHFQQQSDGSITRGTQIGYWFCTISGFCNSLNISTDYE